MAIVQTLRDMVWLLLHPLPRDIKNQDYDFQIMILLVAMNYLSSSLFQIFVFIYIVFKIILLYFS